LRAVTALGFVEIISWGTTVYSLGVLGAPIAADTGWSRTTVFAGLTIGLLASGAVSTRVGRETDARGGRMVMATGSVIAGLALGALAMATSEFVYLATWVAIGVAMRMVLYDAAFSALVQAAPAEGRRAIGYLTLFGGLASTVFWPIGHWLATSLGWRGAILVFAALHLLVCLPLVLYSLRGARGVTVHGAPVPPANSVATAPAASTHEAPPLEAGDRRLAIRLFTIIMSANAFVFAALSVHMVAVIEHAGVATATAVFLASLKGIAQVAGRAWEIVFARHMTSITVGRIAIVLMPAAFVALVLSGARVELILAFTLLFGISNGLVTIVRGAVPLALFGHSEYGTLLGKLAAPQLIASALAPFAFAGIVDLWGYDAGVAAMFAASLVALAGMELLAWWHARRQSGAGR